MVRTYMSMVTYVRRCRCGIDGMVMVVGARPLVKGKQVGRGETPLQSASTVLLVLLYVEDI